jgi:glycosyltransferase involved in cell wall biosynthesis
MRILFLSKRQYMGKDLLDDAYGRFYEIPAELARLGHEVTGLCFSYRLRKEGHIKGPEIDSTSVDWHSMNLGRLILPGGIRYLKRLSELTDNLKPDIIVACSDALHIIMGIRLARKFSLPCVVDLYDNFESFGLSRLPGVMPIFSKAVSVAEGVTCVSTLLMDYVNNTYHPSGLVRTVKNGIPVNLFHPEKRQDCRNKYGLPPDAKIIGTAGAIGDSRGIKILFKAFQELNAQDPSIHFALAGQIEPGTVLPQGNQVHYFGSIDYEDVPLFLNTLDVGVISNLDTSFGRYCFPQKAYEMIACGIPIVAANVGAMKELFKDYPECLFAPNDFHDLTRVIRNQFKKPIIPKIRVSTWPELTRKLESLLIEAVG